jgi:hypothetical protein
MNGDVGKEKDMRNRTGKRDELPNFVKEFMIGNTRIRIADNYCRDKTPEDVQRILKEIGHNAYAAIAAAKEQDGAGCSKN